MKKILLSILLYYSFTASAQTVNLDRCEQNFDTVGYCYNGEVMIPYQYKQGSEFSGMAAAVTNYQNKSALINSQGKEITPFIYDELLPCYHFPGRFACKLGNNIGVIDDKGQEIIPVKYQGTNFQSDFVVDGMMAYFDSNYYWVLAQNGKYGILNCFGKPICNFEYDQIWVDYHWLAEQKQALPIALKKGGKIVLMHPNGKIDTKNEYDAFLGYWGHDCVMRKGKKIVFLNSETWSIVKTHINGEAEQTERLFYAEENNKRGVIDSTGKICIPIIYKNISWISFANEIENYLFGVQKDSLWGLHTIHDKEILPMLYTDIEKICYGNIKMLKLKQNTKWAMFDNNGKQISEFKYDDMYCQSENSAYIVIDDRKGELFFDGREVWK